MVPEQTLIKSMIERIEAELPCNNSNSSIKFDCSEYIDKLTLHNGKSTVLPTKALSSRESSLRDLVEALVSLSIYRLSTIAEALAEALERIPIIKKDISISFNDQDTPIEMLNSQYFLICILSACLQQWRCSHQGQMTDHPDVLTVCTNRTGHSQLGEDTKRSDAALEDRIAHRILASISPFLRQPPRTATAINREIDHRVLLHGTRLNPNETIFTETYNCATVSEHYTAESLLLTRLYTVACRVAFYISIGNWCATYSRIKARLEALSYQPTKTDYVPQVGEVQLMECAAMNKERLNKMLYVIQHTMPYMKQSVQRIVCIIAYRAIWGWIEAFEDEFTQLYKDKGRVDGSPEILFALCRDSTMRKDKELLWPFQTALLLISPGLLVEVAQYDVVKAKRTSCHPSVLEFVRKLEKMAVSGDKRGEDIASICILDICRAASFLGDKSTLSVLHQMVLTAKNDLKERLFNLNRPLTIDKVIITSSEQYGSLTQEQRGGTMIDVHCLLVDALTTLYRLNPRIAVYSIFPVCADKRSPIIYKSSLVKALRILIVYFNKEIETDTASPESIGVPIFYEAIAAPLQDIFIQYVSSLSSSDHHVSTAIKTPNAINENCFKSEVKPMTSASISLTENERLHMIWELLRLYITDPKLVITGETGKRTEQTLRVLDSMIQCMRQPSKSINILATECVRRLHTIDYIPLWGEPGHYMTAFWTVSSHVILSLGKDLLSLRSTQPMETMECFRTVQKVLSERVIFLKGRDQATVLDEWDASCYLQGLITLEVSLLIWTCAPNEDILRANLMCIKEMCKEIAYLFVDNIESKNVSSMALHVLLENYPVYLELSKLCEGPATGRKASQKRIWRLLRMLPHDSPGTLVAWKEVWKRWKLLNRVVGASTAPLPSATSTDQSGARSPRSIGSGGSNSSTTPPLSPRSNSSTERQRLTHHTSNLPITTPPYEQKADNAGASGIKTQWADKNRYTLWHNYTGFLASLSGTCLGKTSGSINDEEGDDDEFYTSTEVDSRYLVTEFIQYLVGLLSCKDVMIREKVKDILSKELSPAVRITLLEQLEQSLSNCVSSSMSFTCLILVEQTSVILSSFLENLTDEPTTSAAVSSQMFASLIDQCATYLLCKPGGTTGVGNDISRIRLRFAHLCETLMTARDSTTWTMLHSEFSLRTKLLSTIVEWTSTFRSTVHTDQSGKSNNSTPLGISEKNQTMPAGTLMKDDDIERELEVACMRAMKELLDGLPLQPKISSSFEPDQDDYMQGKSRLFAKYFSYFVQILQQCISALDDPSKLFLKSSKGSSSDGGISISPGSQHLPSTSAFTRSMHSPNSPRFLRSSTEEGSIDRALDIKSNAIHAIANLVSANMDVGLPQALQMMYDENVNIRSSFVEVFTIILLKDAQFESLSETIHLDRYERLVDILTEESNEFSFAQLLCDSCSASRMDITARCLIRCFSAKKKIVKFLKIMIEKEIRNTDNEAELLRGTTITTRLLSYLAERVGTEYIQRTLHPVFLKLSKQELPKESSYELNPSKFRKCEDLAQNMANVSYAADLILDAICGSAEYAPTAIREICHCISVCANARFPEAKYKSVGAFIFLRFFCPAIVSPESTHFRGKISGVLYRGLLIAGKIAQNLANNVLFGDKESYMFPLNDLLTRNIYRVTRFLREMSKKPPNTSEADAENEFLADEPLNGSDYILLHNVLFDTIHTMSRRLYTKDIPVRYATRAVDHNILSNMILRGQIECISNLLAHLGNPPDMSKKKSSDFCLRGRPLDYANQEYIDFMRRNSDRYVDDLMAKKIVYEAGTSKAGRPVLYVIFRRIASQETDFESMLYLLLRTMELLSAEPFEIVMDFTMYNIDANSSPDRKWFFRLVHLTPIEIYNKIACVYGYNPNVEICKFMRLDLPKPVKLFFSKIQFVVSETEFHRYIHPKELHLPETEAELNTEPLVTVNNTLRHYSNHQKVTPVVLKLTHRYVQVTTVKRQKLFGTVSAYLNDVFAISDIDDIFLGPASSDGSHEIRFRVRRSQTVMTFSSTSNNDAAQFVFIIRRLKSREENEPLLSPADNKLAPTITAIRPQEVPGMLLNIIFVNLANGNQELRLHSYNFLCALAHGFNFTLANQFIETKGICIPKNDLRWIVGISTKLALSQPELTIDLCREWFSGYDKSDEAIQRVCIDYVVPWLSNLGRIYTERSTDTHIATKTLEIVNMLLELTVRSKAAIRDILLQKIWKSIGLNTVDGSAFIDLVITEIIDYAYEHGGIGSIQTEIMTDIMVSMFNTAVWAKLQKRVHDIFLRTSFSWTYHLVNHPCWRRSLAITTRFMLMGSFHYQGPIRNWGPEFAHIITMTAGIGTTLERETVHSLMVNGAASLFIPEKADKARVSRFYDDLRVSTAAKTRLLFGLTKKYTTPFTATLETMTDAIDSVGLNSVEQIVKHLIEGLDIMAPTSDILNAWKARWLGLASSLAFQFNPAIQPRAFIAIGCLAQDAPDDDLIFQILNALQRALADGLFELVLGAIMCLRNVVSGLDETSSYILPIFWIALALVQVDELSLFTASVELLSSVLRTLQERRMIGTRVSAAQRLLSTRHGQIVQEYDRELGVNFEQHFSFAIATILLKHGLSDTEMFQVVKSTLEDFLVFEINLADSPGIPTSALGYVAALLPEIAKHDQMLERMGIMDANSVVSKLNIPDTTSELLFITILTIQLMSHDKPRKAKIYEYLNDAAEAMPDTFAIVYDVIVPKMNRALVNSSDLEFFERIEALLITACSSFPIDSAERTKRKYRTALEEAGFTALIDLQSPRKKDVMGSASLASRLVKHIIS